MHCWRRKSVRICCQIRHSSSFCFSIVRYLIFNEKNENSKIKLASTGQLTPSSGIDRRTWGAFLFVCLFVCLFVQLWGMGCPKI